MYRFFQTQENAGLLILRLTLGILWFSHGAQKMLGWFGGKGFSQTMEMFTNPEMMGLPAVIAFLVIIGEFFGSMALIFGFFTRFCALASGIILTGAAYFSWGRGFFGNELHLFYIGSSLALIIAGGGLWSLDRFIAKKIKK